MEQAAFNSTMCDMMPRLRAQLVLYLGILLLTGGCTDADSLTDVTSVASDAAATQSLDSPASDSLAATLGHSVALALAQAEVRMNLLADFQRSARENAALDWTAYLATASGKRLLLAIDAKGGSSVAANRATESIHEPQLALLRSYDRIAWEGSDDLLVVATRTSLNAFSRDPIAVAYDLRGYPHSVNVITELRPILFITSPPRENRERGRRQNVQPNRVQSTVSTREAEMLVMSNDDCDETAIIPCEPDEGGSTSPVGYTLDATYSWEACTIGLQPGDDLDQDGLRDHCGLELARRFSPRLMMSPADPARGREPYWAVRPGDELGQVKIFYLFAYYRDAGVVGTGWYSHYGDSEFVILTVRAPHPTFPRWELVDATLSAHWQHPTDMTATYGQGSMEYVDHFRGRPVVWVARNKHANYRSRSVCNSGGFYTDTCSDNVDMGNLAVHSNRNIGNLWAPNGGTVLRNCVQAVSGFHPGTECFWQSGYFRGWYDVPEGAPSYNLSLFFFEF